MGRARVCWLRALFGCSQGTEENQHAKCQEGNLTPSPGCSASPAPSSPLCSALAGLLQRWGGQLSAKGFSTSLSR